MKQLNNTFQAFFGHFVRRFMFDLILAAFNFYEDSLWHFLLMLGIQARIIPWTITNSIGVDAKRDFLI